MWSVYDDIGEMSRPGVRTAVAVGEGGNGKVGVSSKDSGGLGSKFRYRRGVCEEGGGRGLGRRGG